jgi:glutaredoxin
MKDLVKSKGYIIPVVIIVLLVGVVLLFSWLQSSDVTGDKVKLDFYVMSQCPYGTQVEDAIKPVLDDIGDNIDFNLYFIAEEVTEGNFDSLHGQPEVLGNIVQLCAIKYNPDKYMEMLACMNKNAQGIPGNWEACADDLNKEKIQACFDGDEGKELLRESIKQTDSVGATGSPTIYLNDQPYAGGRSTMDFYRALCEELDEKPQKCEDLPEPVAVNLVVLNDKRCVECQAAQGLVAQLKGLFPGLVVEELDYMSEKGKALYDSSELTFVPAFLFDTTVSEGEGYAQVQRYLIPQGEHLSLQVGANFNPKMEICDNGIDDTGNGKTDCEEEACKGNMVCRDEIDENLQVFIMSDCPYGRKAIEALKGFNDVVKDVDYEVHYIASETSPGTFNSLHGQYEVDENIIQLCANKYSEDSWFDYLYCRSTKGVNGKDWKVCAEETGVDVDAVEECFDGTEGKALHSEDIKIANALGVGSSPTWLANNKYKFSGIDAETVQQNYCQYNDVSGCENVIAASTTADVPAGSCN